MIFTTYWFLLSVILFLIGYYLLRSAKARSVLLLAFCLLFHAHFAGASGMAPIMVLCVATYLIGRTGNRALCSIGILICVAALCFYKYSRFVARDVLGFWDSHVAFSLDSVLDMILPATPPLAISFFTFEFVHYLFEVRRGGAPIKNPMDFAQFAIFFPSLVSGPIKRYNQFLPSLRNSISRAIPQNIMAGLLQVAFGFFQKVVLADNLANCIDSHGGSFDSLRLLERWIFLVMLALRIFFDFNGYSDIAIGLARMMGIRLPRNFNWPYAAKSIREFWQRWHISLSSWIRDYIYIPLGGSKHGPVRKALSALLAFALCGLWHGAAWNFVLWGLYHGFGLVLCNSYRSIPGVRHVSLLFDRSGFLAWLCTFLFVSFGWLLFFYPAPQALKMFCSLFGAAK